MGKEQGNVFVGVLLVAGTCIGGGMLALPVLTSLGGFIPALAIYFLCWLFMICTGFLFLESCHWMEGEFNLVSMAEKTLGNKGKAAAWGIYLFLFYCLTLAYLVGCGNLMAQVFPIPDWSGPLVFVVIFAPFVILGTSAVGRINLFLMLGLGIAYLAFLFFGAPLVNTEMLLERNWKMSTLALPVAFTSFGYQGIIPTLSHYMNHDAKKMRIAIFVGSLIPLIVYIVWEGLILGIVPIAGEGGLADALSQGQNAVQPLKNFIPHRNVYAFAQFFAFFALATSFFGVTLGLIDFLADGLQIEKDKRGKCWLFCLVFIPPLVFAILYPHIFLSALNYAGGFGCALLLGLLPILMVWSGRYHLQLPSTFSLPGGKPLLLLLIFFVLFVVGLELHQLLS
ncbi:MAG: aromatic amino acid transport family protein [Waddliaceae bacterium]